MNKKLFGLMVCGFVCVSFLSTGFAQTVPAAPVTNTEAPAAMEKKDDAKTDTVKPKKHHSKSTGKKGTKKTGAKKHHKKPATEESKTGAEEQVNKVNN